MDVGGKQGCQWVFNVVTNSKEGPENGKEQSILFPCENGVRVDSIEEMNVQKMALHFL